MGTQALDAVQQRLNASPRAMRPSGETVKHPFGTMKARMVATHFPTKTLPKVAVEMALSQTVVFPFMERGYAYLRISRQRQHRSGLGLEAPRATIERLLLRR